MLSSSMFFNRVFQKRKFHAESSHRYNASDFPRSGKRREVLPQGSSRQQDVECQRNPDFGFTLRRSDQQRNCPSSRHFHVYGQKPCATHHQKNGGQQQGSCCKRIQVVASRLTFFQTEAPLVNPVLTRRFFYKH